MSLSEDGLQHRQRLERLRHIVHPDKLSTALNCKQRSGY